MYERGSNGHDLSYGSGASYPDGNDARMNGAGNGAYTDGGTNPGAEHVWYRSPSGEQAPSPAYPPTPAYPLSTGGSYEPYAPASYEATTFESAYAPAPTQSIPVTPAATTDVTTYDPITGLPMTDGAIVYPMRNVAGRMAMILGVFAILFTSVLFPLFPLAFFFAFGAIMLGRKGRLRARYGFASNPGSAGGGFALGVIAMVLAVVWTAAAAWLFTTYSATDLQSCVTDAHNAAEGIHCVADVIDAG